MLVTPGSERVKQVSRSSNHVFLCHGLPNRDNICSSNNRNEFCSLLKMVRVRKLN